MSKDIVAPAPTAPIPSSFGQQIREARLAKGLNQRKLAKLAGISPTYLSKLENDQTEYAPKEHIIQALARHLELDATELSYLSGRITAEDAAVIQEIVRIYGKQVSVLLRAIQGNPALAQQILGAAEEGADPSNATCLVK